MYKLILFLFFLCPIISLGQKPTKLDSLKTVLSKLGPEDKSFASDTMRVRVLCEMGELYRKQKNDTAFQFAKLALGLSSKLKYKRGQLTALILFGDYYSKQSLSVKAIENYLKALVIAEELKSYKIQISLNAGIGGDYMSLKEFNKAFFYFKNNLNLSQKFGFFEEYVFSNNNLGILFFEQRKYEEALRYFLKCQQISKIKNNPKLSNLGLINIGKVYKELGRLDEAIMIYNKAIKIEDGYKDRVVFLNNELALIYLQKKQYKVALIKAKLAISDSTRLNKFYIKNISQTLSFIYEALNQPEQAFKYYKVYSEISLEQDTIKNNQLVRFMNLDYQNGKQLEKIEGLNTSVKQKESQNKWLFIGVIITLLVALVSLYAYRTIKNKNNLIEGQKAEISDLNVNLENKILLRTAELSNVNKELVLKNFEITEALFKGQSMERTRVAHSLHDNLGGTLSALKWRLGALDMSQLSVKEQEIYLSIKAMMSNAYDDVRNISQQLMPKTLADSGLIAAIKTFIGDLNYENTSLKIEFKHSGNFKELNSTITLAVYEICLELINNTLKHAKANQLILETIFAHTNLSITAQDNGSTPLEISQLKKLNDRVKSLNGTLKVESLEKVGKVVKVEIMLKKTCN